MFAGGREAFNTLHHIQFTPVASHQIANNHFFVAVGHGLNYIEKIFSVINNRFPVLYAGEYFAVELLLMLTISSHVFLINSMTEKLWDN